MSRTNETRHTEWHETCKCKCRLDANARCNLDYENCKCRIKLTDKLVEKCAETNNEVKLAKITQAENENKHERSPCTLYIVLFLVIFTVKVGIGTYFAYYKYMNRNKETDRKEKFHFSGNNYCTQFIELMNGTSQRNKH